MDTDPRTAWDEVIHQRRLPALPAGPWFSAPTMLGRALCTHNLLIEIERYLKRNDTPRPGPARETRARPASCRRGAGRG